MPKHYVIAKQYSARKMMRPITHSLKRKNPGTARRSSMLPFIRAISVSSVKPLLDHAVLNNQDVIRLNAHTTDFDQQFFSRWKGAKFYVDLKRDGERAFIYKKGKDVLIANKYKTVYLPPSTTITSKDLPLGTNIEKIPQSLADQIANSLGRHNGIFDAEYRTNDDDLYTFLSERVNANSNMTMVSIFDALEIDGTNLTQEPLAIRKGLISNLIVPNSRVEVDVTKIANNEQEARKIASDYINQGYEGGVVKPLNHLYDAGEWMLKLKAHRSADLAVLGIEKTKDWITRKVPHSFLVGVFDKKKQEWHIVGEVGTGLDDTTRSQIGAMVEKDQISDREALQAYGKQYDPHVLYAYPEAVLEVEYAKVTPQMHLREPRILRNRHDKSAEECNLTQISAQAASQAASIAGRIAP